MPVGVKETSAFVKNQSYRQNAPGFYGCLGAFADFYGTYPYIPVLFRFCIAWYVITER